VEPEVEMYIYFNWAAPVGGTPEEDSAQEEEKNSVNKKRAKRGSCERSSKWSTEKIEAEIIMVCSAEVLRQTQAGITLPFGEGKEPPCLSRGEQRP